MTDRFSLGRTTANATVSVMETEIETGTDPQASSPASPTLDHAMPHRLRRFVMP